MNINGRTAAFLLGMGLFGAFTWALLAPLFSDEIVNRSPASVLELPSRETLEAMSAEERQAAVSELMQQIARRPGRKVVEEPPEAATSVLLATGKITGADALHNATGRAFHYQFVAGNHLIRLEQLRVTDGPDLAVYLVTHPNPKGSSDFQQGFVKLGALKGNMGSQNFPVPATIDPLDYRSVAIWSELFGTLFASAPLQ